MLTCVHEMCTTPVMLQAALGLEGQQHPKKAHQSQQKIPSSAANETRITPIDAIAASAEQHPGKTAFKGRRWTSKQSGLCPA